MKTLSKTLGAEILKAIPKRPVGRPRGAHIAVVSKKYPTIQGPIIHNHYYAQIKSLEDSGLNHNQIGRQLGITRERVRQISGNRNKTNMTQKRLVESMPLILEMRERGESCSVIAKRCGLPFAAVEGLHLRKSPKPIPHGTLRGYRRGCKCKECMAANAAFYNDQNHKAKEKGLCIRCRKPRGKNGSNWHCRSCQDKANKWHNEHYGNPSRVTSSGIKNIHWSTNDGRWRVVISINGVQTYYGCFRRLSDAKKRLAEVKRELLKTAQ